MPSARPFVCLSVCKALSVADSRRKRRQSGDNLSATSAAVAVRCTVAEKRRQSPNSATSRQCGQGLTLCIVTRSWFTELEVVPACSKHASSYIFVRWDTFAVYHKTPQNESENANVIFLDTDNHWFIAHYLLLKTCIGNFIRYAWVDWVWVRS